MIRPVIASFFQRGKVNRRASASRKLTLRVLLAAMPILVCNNLASPWSRHGCFRTFQLSIRLRFRHIIKFHSHLLVQITTVGQILDKNIYRDTVLPGRCLPWREIKICKLIKIIIVFFSFFFIFRISRWNFENFERLESIRKVKEKYSKKILLILFILFLGRKFFYN